MSDIIYTPPASSGGTTINATNNFIPVRQNATTFVDSVLTVLGGGGALRTVFGGNFTGLNIDDSNKNYIIGNTGGGGNVSFLRINDSGKTISTYYNNVVNGISFDYNISQYLFGRITGGNGTFLSIEDSLATFKTISNGVAIGLSVDILNNLYSFGDFNSVSSGTSFYIDQANSTIYTKHSGQQEGLFFDFVNDYFKIGDFGNTNNGIYLTIDDDNRQVSFTDNNTIDGLFLNYALNTYQLGKITSGSIFSIDAANQYAQITLASIQYMVLDQLNGLYSFGDYSGGQGLQWDNGNNEFVLLQQGFQYIYLSNQTNFFGNNASILSYKIDYNTSILSIGDNAYVQNETLFVVDLSQEIICTQTLSNRKGLLIDFANTDYKFGDFNAVNKGNHIYIEDANNIIRFYTQNLDFNGGNLQSGSSSGGSGQYLKITLNGTQYKIRLDNP